jgi:hypothetical protein
VDWVAGEPNAGSCDTERTDYHHSETEEFVGQTSPAHQSTRRTYTGPASAKLVLISITLKHPGGENMNTSNQEKIKYSQPYSSNSSMHERSSMDV